MIIQWTISRFALHIVVDLRSQLLNKRPRHTMEKINNLTTLMVTVNIYFVSDVLACQVRSVIDL